MSFLLRMRVNHLRYRERVISAREKQNKRYSEQSGVYANAQMDSGLLKKICLIEKAGSHPVKIGHGKTESFCKGL